MGTILHVLTCLNRGNGTAKAHLPDWGQGLHHLNLWSCLLERPEEKVTSVENVYSASVIISQSQCSLQSGDDKQLRQHTNGQNILPVTVVSASSSQMLCLEYGPSRPCDEECMGHIHPPGTFPRSQSPCWFSGVD